MNKILKVVVGLLCSLMLNLPIFGAGERIHNETGYHFSLFEKQYPLATYFTIQSDDFYPGVVKKSIFRVRTNYDLSNADGWQATGIKRVLSLGNCLSMGYGGGYL